MSSLEAATAALASGASQTKPKLQVQNYEKALKSLRTYVSDLQKMKSKGQVLGSIADDLLDDVAPIIESVQALIAS